MTNAINSYVAYRTKNFSKYRCCQPRSRKQVTVSPGNWLPKDAPVWLMMARGCRDNFPELIDSFLRRYSKFFPYQMVVYSVNYNHGRMSSANDFLQAICN